MNDKWCEVQKVKYLILLNGDAAGGDDDDVTLSAEKSDFSKKFGLTKGIELVLLLLLQGTFL